MFITAALAALTISAPQPSFTFVHGRYPRRAVSTAYCLRGIMANGSRVSAGSVAMNGVRLGTRISVRTSPYGPYRRFIVRDRIGHGTQLDFWVSGCSTARSWGRRTVSYRFGW